MADSPARTRRDAVATRSRLVRAALELFATQGYHATTTPAIAARARVAEGTIYRHFDGKEALLNEVFREAQRWASRLVLEDEGVRGVTPADRLRRIAHRLVATAQGDPALVRMLFRPRDAVELDDRSREALREFRSGLALVVATGKQQGAVRSGSAEVWAAVWLSLVGHAVERVAAREWTPDHPHTAQVVEAAWDAIATRVTAGEPRAPSPPPTGAADPGRTSPGGGRPAPGST
ncbi:MAG: TetR/AcrR family transcriptional regulator [Gemmatimonadales bacterium]|nr:TetR/AcrR family transcriptional regulator [Gemmatimonadales bacterium]